MKEEEINFKIIAAITIILPIVISLLYFLLKSYDNATLVMSIPKYNAILNGSNFIVLIAGLVSIKLGKKNLHKIFMSLAIILSFLFLIGYVTYHSQVPSTPFGGVGSVKIMYFFVLISHIILAAALAPLVIITVYKAVKNNFEGHKKIAKFTYPIWLYVSITGLIVYLMISPYYVQ